MRAQAWLFNLNYRHLKAAGPRAAAHMSLHQKLHCQRAHRQKSADSCRSPLLLSGDVCPACWRPSGAAGWLHPVGGEASKQMTESRQQSFCNFVSIFESHRRPVAKAPFPAGCHGQHNAKPLCAHPPSMVRRPLLQCEPTHILPGPGQSAARKVARCARFNLGQWRSGPISWLMRR